MKIGNTSFFDFTNCEWSQLAENGCVSHLPVNCFGALKAAVDTPFLLAFPRAALFSADQIFVSQSIGFRSFYEVFYKSAEISVFFHFCLLWHSLTIVCTIPPRDKQENLF